MESVESKFILPIRMKVHPFDGYLIQSSIDRFFNPHSEEKEHLFSLPGIRLETLGKDETSIEMKGKYSNASKIIFGTGLSFNADLDKVEFSLLKYKLKIHLVFTIDNVNNKKITKEVVWEDLSQPIFIDLTMEKYRGENNRSELEFIKLTLF